MLGSRKEGIIDVIPCFDAFTKRKKNVSVESINPYHSVKHTDKVVPKPRVTQELGNFLATENTGYRQLGCHR